MKLINIFIKPSINQSINTSNKSYINKDINKIYYNKLFNKYSIPPLGKAILPISKPITPPVNKTLKDEEIYIDNITYLNLIINNKDLILIIKVKKILLEYDSNTIDLKFRF